MFKTILVATDGSPSSEKAVESAVRLKLLMPGADITILHVSETPSRMGLDHGVERPPGAVILPGSAMAGLIRERDVILERARIIAENFDVKVRFLTRVGDPASVIMDEANKTECDLVVIGGRGFGGVKSILGSVASRIVNGFQRSVLVIK